MGEVEEWHLLAWGLFWEFLLWILSPYSLKNSMWIYYSKCLAVLLLDRPPLNLAGNQRPIQIRISTMCIFRASQKLFCFNTQRMLLYFQFQVFCTKPTVYRDYTKRHMLVGASFGSGGNSPLRNSKCLNNKLTAAGRWDPSTGPTPALFNFTAICRPKSS